MSDGSVPTITLNNGINIPQIGYGVFQTPPEETERAVLEAFEVGYRHVDTAQAYRNEKGVGAAVAASGLPREDVFVTTKVWISNAGDERAARSINGSLHRLGTDHIDLLLVHQPFGDYYGTYRAMEEALAAGKVRAIGVSDLLPRPLRGPGAARRGAPGRQPDGDPRLQPAGRHPHLVRRVRHCPGVLGPAGPGPQQHLHPPGAQRHRREVRQDRRPGGASLPHPAGRHRHPQVRAPRAHGHQPRRHRPPARRRPVPLRRPRSERRRPGTRSSSHGHGGPHPATESSSPPTRTCPSS